MTRAEVAEKFLHAALTDLLNPEGPELSYWDGYAKFGWLWEHIANENPALYGEDIIRMYQVLKRAADEEVAHEEEAIWRMVAGV
jgi:hypothetical protein